MKTLSEIKATCKEHHTALCRGYVSRKGGTVIIEEYNGRFGKGYTVKTANYLSTNYCYITYYIEEGER